jgi:hypothetical protein
MKNIFIIIFSILSITTFAQKQGVSQSDVEVEKGKNSFGPKEGDLTIGLDVIAPLLRAIGTGSSSVTDFPNKQTFVAKYFIFNDFAVRAKVQANLTNYSDSRFINDDSNLDPLNRTEIEDVRTVNAGDFAIAIGGEFRNNHGKLNTFYGGEIIGLYGYSSEKFHRANAFTSINTTPTYYDYQNNIPDNSDSRMISKNNGNYWGIGANVVVGAEYYFTNNFAIGSELVWGYQYTNNGQESHVNEYLLGGSVKEETIVTSPGEVSNNLGFTNPYVSIYIMFTL